MTQAPPPTCSSQARFTLPGVTSDSGIQAKKPSSSLSTTADSSVQPLSSSTETWATSSMG
ncbi:MAG: hypothetical protein COB69_03970 [Phycisphaera sp.]|nr:MAG: hypothetical protein COB69_03970 [Phycisphaera sp.]